MPPERRKHVRRKPDPGFRVTAQSASAVASGGTTVRSNCAVKIVDLSDKGACLVTTGRLRVGADLHVRIFIEGTDDLYAAKAVVRWAQTWTHNNREADVAGIEFMEVQEVRGQRFRSMGAWAAAVPTSGADKRQQKRRLIDSSKVKCVAAGLFNALGLASNCALSLVDLSEGGCQIVVSKKLETGTRVKLTLGFSNPTVEINVTGEVRHSTRDTLILDPKYTTGIAFKDMAHDEEGRLLMVLRAMDAGGK